MKRMRIISGLTTTTLIIATIMYFRISDSKSPEAKPTDIEQVVVAIETLSPSKMSETKSREQEKNSPIIIDPNEVGAEFKVLYLPTLVPLVRLVASLGIERLSLEDIMTLFKELGIETRRKLAGSSETGERYEIRASHPDKGLYDLHIIYKIVDKKFLFEEITLGLRPEAKSWVYFSKIISEDLNKRQNDEIKLVSDGKDGDMSWIINSEKMMVLKEYSAERPFEGSFPEVLLLKYGKRE